MTTTPAPAAPTAHATSAVVTHKPVVHPAVVHALAGKGPGTFSNPVIPGALSVAQLTTFNLNGTADLAGMGHVHVTGALHSVGFVLTGQATGQLTFSNGNGSVTIQLLGPVQEGFSALPQSFIYRVAAHTGAFKHLTDHGTLTLVLNPVVLGYVPQPHGTFALTI